MATRQYIGARYVPKVYDFNGSSEWRSGIAYEGLTIVTRNGGSYTSKKSVPSNIGEPENNPEFWVWTGNYNAQVELYREAVDEYKEAVEALSADGAIGTRNLAGNSVTTDKLSEEVQVNIFKGYGTPQMYGAKADGITDDTQAFIDAIAHHDIVFVPSGTYILTDTITLGQGKSLIGSGDRTSILMFGNCDGIQLATYADRSGNRLENLFISTIASNEHAGVKMETTNYATLKNIAISNFETGIYGNNSVLNRYYNVYIVYCDTGIYLTNGSYSNTMYSCMITACGVAIDGGVARLIAYDLDIEMSGECDIKNITNVNVYFGNFECSGNAQYSAYIDATGKSYYFNRVTFNSYPTAIYGTTAGTFVIAHYCTFIGCETEIGDNRLSFYDLQYPVFRTSSGSTKTPNLDVDVNKGIMFDTEWSSTGFTVTTNAKFSAKMGTFNSISIGGKSPLIVSQRGRTSVDFGTIPANTSSTFRLTTPSNVDTYTQIAIVGLSNKASYKDLIIRSAIPAGQLSYIEIIVTNTTATAITLGTCDVNYIIL